ALRRSRSDVEHQRFRSRPLTWTALQGEVARSNLVTTRAFEPASRLRHALSRAPRPREGGHRRWRQPQRVDDAKVVKASFGAGPAEQVLGDVELSRRLRGREEAFGLAAVIEPCRMFADHGLTKILVPV